MIATASLKRYWETQVILRLLLVRTCCVSRGRQSIAQEGTVHCDMTILPGGDCEIHPQTWKPWSTGNERCPKLDPRKALHSKTGQQRTKTM